MNHRLLRFLPATGRCCCWPARRGRIPRRKEVRRLRQVVKGAKEYDGLFKLHHKDDHLYAEIQPHQFEKPLLCPIAIARGMGMGGFTLNFDEQWVLFFQPRRRQGPPGPPQRPLPGQKGSPVAKAVETTYTDSVLLALRIQSINPLEQRRHRPERHFHERLRPARPGPLRFQPQHLAQDQGVPAQHRAGSGCHLQRPRPLFHERQRHRRPRQHRRHPLRPVPACPKTATSRAWPTTASAISSASSRTSPPTAATSSFLRYVNRWRLERAEHRSQEQGQALAAQEEDRLLDREIGAGRIPRLCPRRHPRMEQGVREDRLPRRHRSAAAGERGLRPRGHQLQHLPLDHHRPRLRDGAVAGQPA